MSRTRKPKKLEPFEPKLVITSTLLDLELCELLGDKPSDYVILLANGKQVPGFGTPEDSPAARARLTAFCLKLNSEGGNSLWPEFAKNWGSRLSEICPPETRPVFSWELHRVCVGWSQYDHCAIRLFLHLRERVSGWRMRMSGNALAVEITMHTGNRYVERGTALAAVVCNAVVRALRESRGIPL